MSEKQAENHAEDSADHGVDGRADKRVDDQIGEHAVDHAVDHHLSSVGDVAPNHEAQCKGVLSSLLHLETTLARLGASGQLAAIHELVGLFIKIVPTVNPNELVTLFEQRERFCSTATIDGVAFPFAELDGIEEPILALACSRDGVDFGSPRGELTELFVALVTPVSQPQLTVQLLARLTRLFQSTPQLKDQLVHLQTPTELRALFSHVEACL